MRAPRITHLFAAAAVVAAGIVTAAAGSASAATHPTVAAHPTVSAAGQAYMGWHAKAGAATSAVTPQSVSVQDTVTGIDVSSWQGSVDWASYWNQGYRFAYIKATEGTTYQSSTFSDQYTGSYNQGFIRGAYHFATPNTSSGAVQAQYFVAHGGGWSADGKTLPGTLDIEFNPYDGNTCYDMTPAALTSWVSDFLTTYKSLTTRDAVIYTNTSWWNQCVGGDFSATNPLWVANYSSDTPALPGSWTYYTFHQYSDSPVDQDRFSAGMDRLQVFATG